MKTAPSQSPPESKPISLVEKLDAPLSTRGFFLGISFLTQAIGVESALARGEIEAPPQELQILPGYAALCEGYLEALREVEALRRAQRETLKRFNEAVSN